MGSSATQIPDLDWWEEGELGNLRIIATPTRHYSGRGLSDYKAKLWSSWSIVGPSHRIYYSGDTGYAAHFKEIGKKLGPFDLTLIKIGAYGPGQSWIDVHMEPEPAMQAHLDVKGGTLLPVHWGTFNSRIPRLGRTHPTSNYRSTTAWHQPRHARIGEWIEVPAARPTQAWWEAKR